MVRHRVLRRDDVPEVQAVALKAWMFAYRRYGLSLKLIRKFVSERYSTDSFEKTVLPSVQKGESQFYLATDKGKIIGFSNTGPGVWGWELYRIYLLPEYIGEGVGKKLLLLCEDFLREKKARKYHAYVWEKNKAALDFYKRNGFAKLEGKNKSKVEICIEKKLTSSPRQRSVINKSPIFSPNPKSKPAISRALVSTLIARGMRRDRRGPDKPITQPSQKNKPRILLRQKEDLTKKKIPITFAWSLCQSS